MKIVLPWPDKRLTPNAKRRKHWRSYQPAINADRETGRVLTRSAMAQQGWFYGFDKEKVDVSISFFPPDHRHRDDDGMIGAFKHMRDGIADALGVNDRCFRPHYFFEQPEKPGRVEVEFSTPNVFCAPSSGQVTGMSPDEQEAT